MGRHFALPLALLFIALGVSSNAQSEGAGEAGETRLVVQEGAPLTVECALRVDERAEWRLDGAAPPADLRPAGEAAPGGRLRARLHAPAARAHHAGVYTCARPPAQRVRLIVRAATPPGEPTPSVAPSTAEPAADAPPVVYYDVGRSFALNCTVPAPPGGSASYVWRKNDTALEEVKELTKRYELAEGGAVMRITGRSNEEDYGVYSCGLVGAPAALVWDMRGRPHAKLAPNSNVIENQALKLTCKVIGKPYPPVTWTFSNSTLNGTEVQAALGERATLRPNEQGVEGGELVLSAAQRSDAGEYSCAPTGGAAAVTVVRVKDQFAALWPFLGICAEVFVLCAVILVYEKRRTKPELDDSDTDNHEQKKS